MSKTLFMEMILGEMLAGIISVAQKSMPRIGKPDQSLNAGTYWKPNSKELL